MSSPHKQFYKNYGLDSTEMRRRRGEAGIQLRKNKREEQFLKRRGVDLNPATSSTSTEIESSNSSYLQSDDINESSIGPIAESEIDQELIQMLYSGNESDQVKAAKKIRSLLARESDPPVDEVIKKGLVPQLVTFLRNNSNTTLQFEAAWILTNIASGTSFQTRIVIEAGAVPFLIGLLATSNDADVQNQAVWALGNIAGDSRMCRDHLLNSGILMPLLHVLDNSERTNMIRNSVWVLCHLCFGKNPPVDFTKIVCCLPILARLLDIDDVDVLKHTCLAISFLADGPNNQIQAVLEAGVSCRLVELLLYPQQQVCTAALRAVANIATGEDEQIQVLLGHNVLVNICQLLHSPWKTIKKESCWIISNIAAGNRALIQALIDAGLFTQLITIMKTAEFRTRKTAAWAIANATSNASCEQILYLVQVGCLPPMCEFLTVMDSDIILGALNALENILKAGEHFTPGQNPYGLAIEECGGLEKIEFLQGHENREIYQKSFDIIGRFFEFGEEESVMAPEQFTFDPHNMPTGGFNF
uniref:Importin subunit alpha n=1 Tax=Drosophila rhopaloa TaxID=1041015 RepID=A0A6P4FLY1_DRORH